MYKKISSDFFELDVIKIALCLSNYKHKSKQKLLPDRIRNEKLHGINNFYGVSLFSA